MLSSLAQYDSTGLRGRGMHVGLENRWAPMLSERPSLSISFAHGDGLLIHLCSVSRFHACVARFLNLICIDIVNERATLCMKLAATFCDYLHTPGRAT